MSEPYRVKPGDSLSKIAKDKYRDASRWPSIAKANNLKEPYKIFVGQELIIPKAQEAAVPNAAIASATPGKNTAAPKASTASAPPKYQGKALTVIDGKVADRLWYPAFENVIK